VKNATADAKPASDTKPGPDENPAGTVPENDTSGKKRAGFNFTADCPVYSCSGSSCSLEALKSAPEITCYGSILCGVRDGNTDSPKFGCDEIDERDDGDKCIPQLEKSTPNPCFYIPLFPPEMPIIEATTTTPAPGPGGETETETKKTPGGGSGSLAGGWKLTLGGAVLVSFLGLFYGL